MSLTCHPQPVSIRAGCRVRQVKQRRATPRYPIAERRERVVSHHALREPSLQSALAMAAHGNTSAVLAGTGTVWLSPGFRGASWDRKNFSGFVRKSRAGRLSSCEGAKR